MDKKEDVPQTPSKRDLRSRSTKRTGANVTMQTKRPPKLVVTARSLSGSSLTHPTKQEDSSKRNIITSLGKKLKSLEELYKKSIKENLNMTNEYNSAAKDLATHKLIGTKLLEENKKLQKKIEIDDNAINEWKRLEQLVKNWKKKYEALITSSEKQKSDGTQQQMYDLSNKCKQLELLISRQNERFSDYIDAVKPNHETSNVSTYINPIKPGPAKTPPTKMFSRKRDFDDIIFKKPFIPPTVRKITPVREHVNLPASSKADFVPDAPRNEVFNVSHVTMNPKSKAGRGKHVQSTPLPRSHSKRSLSSSSEQSSGSLSKIDLSQIVPLGKPIRKTIPASSRVPSFITGESQQKFQPGRAVSKKTKPKPLSTPYKAKQPIGTRPPVGKNQPTGTKQPTETKQLIETKQPTEVQQPTGTKQLTGTEQPKTKSKNLMAPPKETSDKGRQPDVLSFIPPAAAPSSTPTTIPEQLPRGTKESPSKKAADDTIDGLTKIFRAQKEEIADLQRKLGEIHKQHEKTIAQDRERANQDVMLLEQYEKSVNALNDRYAATMKEFDAVMEDNNVLKQKIEELENILGEKKDRPSSIEPETTDKMTVEFKDSHPSLEDIGNEPKKKGSQKELLRDSTKGQDDTKLLGLLLNENEDLERQLNEKDLQISNQKNEIDELEHKLIRTEDDVKPTKDAQQNTCLCADEDTYPKYNKRPKN